VAGFADFKDIGTWRGSQHSAVTPALGSTFRQRTSA
jgi:hypothetical protein